MWTRCLLSTSWMELEVPFDRQREVESLLANERHDTGRLWRMRRDGLDEATIANQLGGTPGHLNNIEMQLAVLIEGHVPTAKSRALKGAQKLGGWLRDQELSSSLRHELVEQHALLRAIADGRDAPEDARGVEGAFDYPTIEWVKDPVDLETGLPNGRPIVMRHFNDCDHWFRDDENRLLGDAPRLATDHQMRSLPACKDCVTRAERSGNPRTGPRLSEEPASPLDPSRTDLPVESGHGSDQAFVPTLVFEGTDADSLIRIRREQGHLRRHLLRGESEAACSICGRVLPSALLVAAHIVPRRLLDDAERLDFASAAMLACTLGCDTLFEFGYITVDADGLIAGQRSATTEALVSAVDAVLGLEVSGMTEARAASFERHRLLHARRGSE